MDPFLLNGCNYVQFQDAIHFIESRQSREQNHAHENENLVFDAFSVIKKCVDENSENGKQIRRH